MSNGRTPQKEPNVCVCVCGGGGGGGGGFLDSVLTNWGKVV